MNCPPPPFLHTLFQLWHGTGYIEHLTFTGTHNWISYNNTHCFMPNITAFLFLFLRQFLIFFSITAYSYLWNTRVWKKWTMMGYLIIILITFQISSNSCKKKESRFFCSLKENSIFSIESHLGSVRVFYQMFFIYMVGGKVVFTQNWKYR